MPKIRLVTKYARHYIQVYSNDKYVLCYSTRLLIKQKDMHVLEIGIFNRSSVIMIKEKIDGPVTRIVIQDKWNNYPLHTFNY